jgi:hypothetical protein
MEVGSLNDAKAGTRGETAAEARKFKPWTFSS